MQKANEATTAAIKTTDATRDAIKDAGLVRLGAGNIHFSDPVPSRDSTKDAGRVRMGAGNIQF